MNSVFIHGGNRGKVCKGGAMAEQRSACVNTTLHVPYTQYVESLGQLWAFV